MSFGLLETSDDWIVRVVSGGEEGEGKGCEMGIYRCQGMLKDDVDTM